jgi:hypothetical protein
MGVAAVAALVGTLAIAAGVVWLIVVDWAVAGAGGAGAVAATWAGRHPRPAQPELRLLQRSTSPPGRITCAHYNVVMPFVVAADCAVCGPLSPEDVPAGPTYGGV